MNIVLIANDIHTLIDIIITNPIREDLVSQAASSWGVATMITI
jgi:hypothetical protein